MRRWADSRRLERAWNRADGQWGGARRLVGGTWAGGGGSRPWQADLRACGRPAEAEPCGQGLLGGEQVGGGLEEAGSGLGEGPGGA